MTYIEAHKGKQKWISGIFLSRQDAEKYFNSIPDEMRCCQELKDSPFKSYPVYIIESFDFVFTDLEGVSDAIKAIVRIADDEATYMNIYRITADYQPPEPGMDYMGILDHEHVSNFFLGSYGKTGGGFTSI